MAKHPRLLLRGTTYYHRAAVPKDIRETYGKSEEIASLKTKDYRTAQKLVRIEAARVDALFQAHRDRLARLQEPPLEDLTDDQIALLSSALFASILQEDERERLKGFRDDDDFDLYAYDIDAAEQMSREFYARGKIPAFVSGNFDELVAIVGADWRLSANSIAWPKLARAMLAEIIKAAEVKRRRNSGDVIETPPIPSALASSGTMRGPIPGKSKVSLKHLFKLWKTDHIAAERSMKTVADMEARIDDFIKYVGHDNAEEMTGRELVAYCETLRHERGLSPKTISTSYLAAIRSVFRLGKRKFAVSNDPSVGVRYVVPKRKRTRPKGFTTLEATTILTCTLKPELLPPGMLELNKFAIRWVPWICAYTGARVGEIAQLRRQDFMEESGIRYIQITPEAGTVKTGEYRYVPLHSHLLEMGLWEIVMARPKGHLFFVPDDKERQRGHRQSDNVSGTVRDFVREIALVTDERVWPNHGWRHRFKTVARDVDIEQRYMDVIQGHSDGSASADYGDNTMIALSREIEKLPRYVVSSADDFRKKLMEALSQVEQTAIEDDYAEVSKILAKVSRAGRASGLLQALEKLDETPQVNP